MSHHAKCPVSRHGWGICECPGVPQADFSDLDVECRVCRDGFWPCAICLMNPSQRRIDILLRSKNPCLNTDLAIKSHDRRAERKFSPGKGMRALEEMKWQQQATETRNR